MCVRMHAATDDPGDVGLQKSQHASQHVVLSFVPDYSEAHELALCIHVRCDL